MLWACSAKRRRYSTGTWNMATKPFLFWLLMGMSAGVLAQDRIYRCGNEYLNDARAAEARGCKSVEGGNVTVVQGTRANPSAAAPAKPAVQTTPGTRVDPNEQRARDAESRTILEAELSKAQAKLTDLLKEYNNGEPDKRGAEGRNYQKYLDRLTELKSGITRSQDDVAGLQRELSRLAPTAP